TSETRIHHRSASHAGPQGTRKGSEIELPRASDDGESERTGGEHTGDHGLRFGGVSCRAADGGTVARLRASHVGSRERLRPAGVRGGTAMHGRYTTGRSE